MNNGGGALGNFIDALLQQTGGGDLNIFGGGGGIGGGIGGGGIGGIGGALNIGLNQPAYLTISERADTITNKIAIKIFEHTKEHIVEQVDMATQIHSLWRARTKDTLTSIDMYIKTVESLMNKCFDTLSEDERNDIFIQTQRFSGLKDEVQSMLDEFRLEPLGKFGRQDEAHPDDEFNFKNPILKPFSVEKIARLNEIETDCYMTFVMHLMPVLQKVQVIKQGLMDILKHIVRMWDSGEEVKVIKTETIRLLKEKLVIRTPYTHNTVKEENEGNEVETLSQPCSKESVRSLVETFSQPRLEMFANELFVTATSHKPERVRLNKKQLGLLELVGKDHSKVNGTQCFCLEEADKEEDCRLPCCFQCLHKECAMSHFKRQVECPYCKKDLRKILTSSNKKRKVDSASAETNSSEIESESVNESANEEDDREENEDESEIQRSILANRINEMRNQMLNNDTIGTELFAQLLNATGFMVNENANANTNGSGDGSGDGSESQSVGHADNGDDELYGE